MMAQEGKPLQIAGEDPRPAPAPRDTRPGVLANANSASRASRNVASVRV
jgi:hypothetical protein